MFKLLIMETKEVKKNCYLVRCHSIGREPVCDLVLKTHSDMKKYVEELRKTWTFVDAGKVDFLL